jgi:creatinine amidohydrolase
MSFSAKCSSKLIKVNLLTVCLCISLSTLRAEDKKAVYLENLTWIEAEEVLKEYGVVMFALGARTKEHGPHLQLNNDFLMAEYLKSRVAEQVPVVILPTLQYGYYPAFLEYPGSVSLRAETFVALIQDICHSLSGYGIKKFYALNTGVSTLRPLKKAAEDLKTEGIHLRYLNILEVDKNLPPGLLKQEGGTHADEGETSMMLYIAPETVNMKRAVKEYDPRPNRPGLTRNPKGKGSFSATGIYGDPTLATREKGKIIVEATVEEIVKQIQTLLAWEIE